LATWFHVRWLIVVTSLLGGAGCGEQPVDTDPARVVEAFVDRMRGVHGNPTRARMAFDLISAKGRANLEERASRASAAAGRPVAPEEMLAPSRFSLTFEPVRYRAEIKGKWSRVIVTGSNPDRELASIRAVKEEPGWRVELDLLPLPPIQKRE
jgi:hypothetical protein